MEYMVDELAIKTKTKKIEIKNKRQNMYKLIKEYLKDNMSGISKRL